MKSKYLIAPALIVLDQLLRLAAQAAYPAGTMIERGDVGIGYLRHPESFTWFSLIVLILLAITIRMAIEVQRWPGWELLSLALAILVAGMLSNMGEYMLRGFVTDYALVFPGPGDGWAFNLADLCVAIGLGLCLLQLPRLVWSLRPARSGGGI